MIFSIRNRRQLNYPTGRICINFARTGTRTYVCVFLQGCRWRSQILIFSTLPHFAHNRAVLDLGRISRRRRCSQIVCLSLSLSVAAAWSNDISTCWPPLSMSSAISLAERQIDRVLILGDIELVVFRAVRVPSRSSSQPDVPWPSLARSHMIVVDPTSRGRLRGTLWLW